MPADVLALAASEFFECLVMGRACLVTSGQSLPARRGLWPYVCSFVDSKFSSCRKAQRFSNAQSKPCPSREAHHHGSFAADDYPVSSVASKTRGRADGQRLGFRVFDSTRLAIPELTSGSSRTFHDCPQPYHLSLLSPEWEAIPGTTAPARGPEVGRPDRRLAHAPPAAPGAAALVSLYPPVRRRTRCQAQAQLQGGVPTWGWTSRQSRAPHAMRCRQPESAWVGMPTGDWRHLVSLQNCSSNVARGARRPGRADDIGNCCSRVSGDRHTDETTHLGQQCSA